MQSYGKMPWTELNIPLGAYPKFLTPSLLWKLLPSLSGNGVCNGGVLEDMMGTIHGIFKVCLCGSIWCGYHENQLKLYQQYSSAFYIYSN